MAADDNRRHHRLDRLLQRTDESETEWLDRELTRQRIGLTDIILCEVLQGLKGDASFRIVQLELSQFEIFTTGGIDLAIATARNYKSLRSRGITIRKTIDCLIATSCIVEGHSLLHRDRDFDPFAKHLGLQVIHP